MTHKGPAYPFKTLDLNGGKVYTHSRNRALLRFLLNSEDPMNDEPIQNHLYPVITLRYCAVMNESSELLNDP
jgi:hypothetical protein